ncbi:MAG: hypothetical protein JSU90_01485, partial [Nitrospiraceae bacterium]
GTPAFKSTLQVEYAGDVVPRFTHVTPSGSAGDVQAKGQWKDGMWTIEFSRALNTGNTDDVAFNPDKAYQFGVSRYEIAGREPDPQLTQPLYGSGDISEDLTLTFGK